MQKIKYTLLIGLATAFFSLFLTSCGENYPENIESPNQVVLKSIKIVNAGKEGNTVVEGVIDENAKTVWFPRIDPETNLSAIKFEAEMSDGAKLNQEAYEFSFEEGNDAKTIVIKIVNEPRFREYFVTLRLNIPVFGADFNKFQIYDNTNNELGNPVYPSFKGLSTRGTGFDGEHVLIVTRATEGSHLLKVEDLKKNEIKPIPLNLTGVAGGTFVVNCGAQIHGHTYIANLSGGLVSPLKIYHWTDPTKEPEVIANINKANIEGAGARHGDNLSVNVDENGNGYMFFGDNAVTQILRLKVTNFTSISEPTILPTQTGVTGFMNMNRVGKTEEYLLTGYEAPIMVTSNEAQVSYKMKNASIPLTGSDPRVVYFNDERYLLMTTAARRGDDAVAMYVYDITKGSSIAEALKIFEEGTMQPLYQYPLLGPINSAPSTQSGWFVEKDAEGNDDKLLLFSASADAGFVIVEFPKKTLDD
ncbi:MAG TPA: DUF4623 domain-containing protein [Porphyromonadaceae bacterium]|nr:DUF4623 domain-containing protein [Porphyromonadaceae bacterium]HBL34114.1 DUF4623 domain-containing protein [Porphyromonadaceae bacterium]HBX21038.1 DUF4623 domain-containing protein [Porphyromonadaceae bacterium]HCM19221.1 DUF4623 domain-containing protein [Porphyromonadaceae bacterium]